MNDKRASENPLTVVTTSVAEGVAEAVEAVEDIVDGALDELSARGRVARRKIQREARAFCARLRSRDVGGRNEPLPGATPTGAAHAAGESKAPIEEVVALTSSAPSTSSTAAWQPRSESLRSSASRPQSR